jgi:hypothetical protein
MRIHELKTEELILYGFLPTESQHFQQFPECGCNTTVLFAKTETKFAA